MKLYIRSTQPIFAGTKYDKKAAQKLVDSGLYTEDEANNIVRLLFTQDIHAFVHAPNWAEKYLVGIIRMALEEGHGTKQGVSQFLGTAVDTFEKLLTFLKEGDHREKLGGANFDSQFMNEMSYQDVMDMMSAIQEELERQSEEELAKLQSDRAKSNYELVPITSYEQMHNLFGGSLTGDGSSDKAAGMGGTAWCHTNGKGTYDSWVRRGGGMGAKFYVLARKDFKDLTFNPETNRENPKDEYGNSLIALLVDKKTGELLNATLRCNHANNVVNADNQYKTYGELSQLVGFNVKDAVMEDLGDATGYVKIKEVSIDKPKFAVGDRIQLSIMGYGDFTATAVKKASGSMLFVFDGVVKYGKMANINAHLDKIFTEIENSDFKDRVNEYRLLTASEVFSGCDEPEEWSYITNFGVEMDGSQIPYFISSDNRGLPTDEDRGWWTSSLTEDEEHYVVVKNDGSGNCYPDKKLRGIRPAFTVADL